MKPLLEGSWTMTSYTLSKRTPQRFAIKAGDATGCYYQSRLSLKEEVISHGVRLKMRREQQYCKKCKCLSPSSYCASHNDMRNLAASVESTRV